MTYSPKRKSFEIGPKWPGQNPRLLHTPINQIATGTRAADITVTIGAMASQITSLPIVYSNVYSGADQRKHQSSKSLAFVRGIQQWPMNAPQKWPVTRKMFLFDDIIMS